MATPKPSFKEVKESVQKDSSQRLNAEVLRSTDLFTKEDTTKWPRRQLVNTVSALRHHAGQTHAVKTFLSDFTFEHIPIMPRAAGDDTDERPQTPIVRGETPPTDILAVIAAMQQQTQIQIATMKLETEERLKKEN